MFVEEKERLAMLRNELMLLSESLRSKLPCSIDNKEGKKLEANLKKVMAELFLSMETAFPYHMLTKAYDLNVKEVAPPKVPSPIPDGWDWLDNWIKGYSAVFADKIAAQLARIYITGNLQMTSYGVTKKLGLPIVGEGPPWSAAVDWANNYSAGLVTNMDIETRSQLAQIIGDGIENKRGIEGISRDIRAQFTDMSKARADMIAQTETNSALSQAAMDKAQAWGVDGKEWVAADSEPCEICQGNADQGVIPIDEPFDSGDDQPPAHPNCLLPGNKVIPLGMVAMTRAFYSGKVIELQMSSGNCITITPNHPILTPLGFVAAERLSKGDDVISCIDSERVSFSLNPNYNHVPTAIEQIWNSLSFSSDVSRSAVKTSPVDFHGDARFFDGNVDIILTNRFLKRYIRNALVSQHLSQNNLNLGNAQALAFSGFSSHFPFCKRLKSNLGDNVGSGGSGLALLEGHKTHGRNVGLAPIARGDASLNQSPADNAAAYLELSRQFQLRFSGLITADEIIKIRSCDYYGHVYNLQSLEELYINNSVIVKNCRCSFVAAHLNAED